MYLSPATRVVFGVGEVLHQVVGAAVPGQVVEAGHVLWLTLRRVREWEAGGVFSVCRLGIPGSHCHASLCRRFCLGAGTARSIQDEVPPFIGLTGALVLRCVGWELECVVAKTCRGWNKLSAPVGQVPTVSVSPGTAGCLGRCRITNEEG